MFIKKIKNIYIVQLYIREFGQKKYITQSSNSKGFFQIKIQTTLYNNKTLLNI